MNNVLKEIVEILNDNALYELFEVVVGEMNRRKTEEDMIQRIDKNDR